jgi:hypothetical protein
MRGRQPLQPVKQRPDDSYHAARRPRCPSAFKGCLRHASLLHQRKSRRGAARDQRRSTRARPAQGARAACLGVGAGALPRFLRRAAPALAVDAVELDPAVAAAARRCFGFPPPQARRRGEEVVIIDTACLLAHQARSRPGSRCRWRPGTRGGRLALAHLLRASRPAPRRHDRPSGVGRLSRCTCADAPTA